MVPGGGLMGHEGIGAGHTIANHVPGAEAGAAEIQESLARRLVKDQSIKAASAFSNRTIAESVISDALEANSSGISTWLAGSAFKYVFKYSAGKVVGVTLKRGATLPALSQDVVVVLVRNTSPSGYCFTIKTAFPYIK
jgi:hypothetical protein